MADTATTTSSRYLSPNWREFRTHSAPDIVLTTSNGESSLKVSVFEEHSCHPSLSRSADTIHNITWNRKVHVYTTDATMNPPCEEEEEGQGYEGIADHVGCSRRRKNGKQEFSDFQMVGDGTVLDSVNMSSAELEQQYQEEDISNKTLLVIFVVFVTTGTALIVSHLVSNV